eukprot:403372085
MPVWFDYEFSYSNQGKKVVLSIDCLINFFMMIRIYLVLRLLTKLTQWRNKKAQKFCNEEGIDADTIFSLKCLMQTKPYTVLLISFIILSVMFGFAVRTLERPYYQDDSTGGQEQKGAGYQDYNFMMNGWWLIVVTMTTVGFGDFFARTYLGRTVSVMACFTGTFLVSLMVVTLSSSSKFKFNQQRAFNSLRSIANFERKKKAAAKYILYSLILYKFEKFMKTDKFNPILYQKREELQIKKQESRKEFRYLYKSVIANQNTAILLLEDIDEKADLVLKEIAQVVQLKKEINAQLDKLLSYQQKNLEQLKEVHTNFKKIEAPLSKSQYLLMGTSMIQQLEEQQKKKKDVKVQKQLNIDAKLQQEIQIQQKNRDLLKFKLTKIKQELEHRLKDEKYQGENQSPKIQINENNKIVNRMQQRRALTPQSENLSHIQKFFGASSRNQNNHYQSFRKLDRMLTRSRLYSQDEDKSPSRKVAMNVIDEQTPKESLNAFGNSYTKGLRVQSKSPNKADSPVLTQKSPLSQFYRNEESQIQRTYFKKNNYVNDKTQKLQQKQEESKQQQLNSEDKMGIFNQSLENLKKKKSLAFKRNLALKKQQK